MRRKRSSSLFGNYRRRSAFNRQKRDTRLSLELLETRNLLAVATFQQGLANYAGQQDTILYSRTPDVNSGTEGSMSPDQQDANGVRQGLMKFEDIIGNMAGQIPVGATINRATLIVNVVNDSNSAMQMSLYRMLTDWSESTATWNSFGEIGGVQASEGEASDFPPDGILYDSDTTGNSATAGLFDVTRSLEYWVANPDSNFGWLIESAATNGWDFRTKESAQSQRPMLVVEYNAPTSTEDFQILHTSIVQAEGDTTTTKAVVEVARLGNIGSAASINYTVTAGGPNPAGAGDFVAVPVAQTLNFAAGEGIATIEVTINGDTELEGFETVLVSLTGGDVVAGRNVATIHIADNDALINEVLANITNSVDDETDREYIELIGTPNAFLNNYYFVVFEGEEEGDDGSVVGGAAAGRADLVINLNGLQFGENGLLVLTPQNWEYAAIADPLSNVVALAQLNGAVLEDSSQTYALIRSPLNPIVQGTDYDTVGVYENQTNQAIGGTLINPNWQALNEAPRYTDLLGDLELPAGAQVVDSVGVVEGGGDDRDRVAAAVIPGEISARPGVHVHQPTAASGSNVASDAVSRRIGQTLPNSIGAWFNGDINNGVPVNGVIKYLENTFFISVVAPDGAVLTPGSHNILRNVFFNLDDQDISVAESTGSVTLHIERTGDLDEEIEVFYQTVDIGSADEGADYTPVMNSVMFGTGESSKEITILINSADGIAEGFERFRVDITSVSDPTYQITNGLASIGRASSEPAVINGQAVVTISDADVSTRAFRNGLNGYTGTSDAYIDGELTSNKFGQDPVIRVDQVKGEGEDEADVVRPQQGLIRFDNMFGNGANQVPFGSTIFDAFLTVNVTNTASGADIRFFRMLQNWEEVNATWTDPQGSAGSLIVNGVTPDNTEATSVPDARVPSALSGQPGEIEIPLNVDTIQAWANGSLPNFGWSIINDLGSLWSFNSSEAVGVGTFRPELTILYTAPEVDMENVTGSFSFSVDDYVVNEGVDGGMATITVNRIGGFGEAANVNWSVSAGTGDLTDITGATAGVLSFDEDDLFKTFQIAIDDDSLLERNETLNLSLSGEGLSFGRDSATLKIRDNDFLASGAQLLLNEFWINSPGNDPPYEFVELLGDPGIGLGSLYYVAIEGLIGDHEGTAEKVVSLGDYFNGSNGLSLLTPDAADFGFHVPTGTTQIDGLGSIGTENVASQNDSTTYMLLYSPLTDLTTTSFDYDWNNDGGLELPPGVEIIDSVAISTGGVEDQLYGTSLNRIPFTSSDPDVDAISRMRGNTFPNRGSAWFGGDLFPAGDDYLMYETAEAFFLPVTGAALTPGEINTGSAAQSPLVSLTSITPNEPVGTFTVTFSAPVSQLVTGNGGFASPNGAGVTITHTDGTPLDGVDSTVVVTGLGTNTLTLSFTGSGVIGGFLPEGAYQLNFVGNGIIANGRAVDVAANGAQINGFREYEFQVGAPILIGDYNNDGTVNAADYTVYRDNVGGISLINEDPDASPGVVNRADYTAWKMHYGQTLGEGGSGGSVTVLSDSGGGSLAFASIVEPGMATLVPAEVVESAPAAAPKLAFVDLAFANPASMSFSAEAADADAALPTRTAAGGSASLDASLLLESLYRNSAQRAAADGAVAADETDSVDEVFAELGEMHFGCSLADAIFGHAV